MVASQPHDTTYSSAEAEYRVMTSNASELIWIK
jgi:hypothetical protein